MLFMISLELQHEIDSIIFTDDEEKKAYCRYKFQPPSIEDTISYMKEMNSLR